MSARARAAGAVVIALLALSADSVVRGQDAVATGGFDALAPSGELDGEISAALGQIERHTTRKARVDAELAGLGERRAQAQRRLRTRARALYRLTRGGLLPAASGPDALLSHLGRVTRLERMVVADVHALEALRDRGTDLRRETTELAESIDQGRARARALEARKSTFQTEQRTSAAFEAAFTRSAPRLAERADEPVYGTIRVVGEAPGDGFARMRGALPLPVAGATELREGRRAESDGPGLELIAPMGAPVRAVAAGRVAFSDRHGSYGQLVIVDHGDHYYTVYGGLGHVVVQAGDDLSQSARIGDVGADTTPAALYFEVRRGARTLDARSWLGI